MLQDLIRPRQAGHADFTFIDLFAGIGGLRYGFEVIGGRCVFACERDKFSQATYRANFPYDDHDIAGEINDVGIQDIPAHDVLLAGFPCQPFSIAGVSKKNALGKPHGFACETQGNLFYRLAEIIRHHRPKAFLLENVKNLVRHDRGNTFRVIHEMLEEDLGYHIAWRVVNAKSWVPQHRERIFIVGFREDYGFCFESMTVPDPEDGPKLASILHPENGQEPTEKPYTTGDSAAVVEKYTLNPHLWQYLQNYSARHRAKGNGFGYSLVGPEDVSRTLSARYHKDGSEILVRQQGKRPRRLTPRECARLMGFDTNERRFVIPVSDTQAYRQFGNAVVVPVAEAVARHMQPCIVQSLQKTHKGGLRKSA